MEIAEGDLFSETKIDRSRRRVLSHGYFERVDVSTEQVMGADMPLGQEPMPLMNLNVEVGEKPTGTFQVGAGFSSIENFIGQAQVAQNTKATSSRARSTVLTVPGGMA